MDNYAEKDYLEMPFGPPPILPDVKTELKEYIVYPEKLPIHQIDRVQQYWERERNILSLLKTDITPLGTTLKYDRNPITGCIGDLQEVCIKSIGQNVRNSMSMTRAPAPIDERITGNASNFLFWPGGFEEPQVNTEDNFEIDFEKNLRILAKGFRAGIEFMPDNYTPKSLNKKCDLTNKGKQKKGVNIDMKSIINQEGYSLVFKPTDIKHEENKENENVQNKNVDVPDMDEFIQPFNQMKIPCLKISEHSEKMRLQKTEWAEQINLLVSVKDFDKKILEPAMTFPYELDNFQKQAILKLEEHQHVFVAAHTSAGKTTIAEYAIAMSEKHMTRTIYTSPIKALSNQKYREFKEKFKDVGLITGDVQINPTGTCLIMTTEILQSMLYCAAEVIRDVEYVVFDEVHYINDEDRGHVWEEVIILLPPTVNIVMLSATVPNPLQFAHWVGQTKRRKMYVISTLKRPVPLQHYLYTGHDPKCKKQLYLLIDKDGNFLRDSIKEVGEAIEAQEKRMQTLQQKKFTKFKPSSNITLLKNATAEAAIDTIKELEKKENAPSDKLKNQLTAKDKRMWSGLLGFLKAEDKLPVVIFCFSKNNCNKIAESFTESLVSHEERLYVKTFFKKSIKHLKDADSRLPQVIKMQQLLQLGIGIHHSGILPILKEIVEMLFQKGIVKVLLATETFAMGVNMPTKTVVFDTIRKYDSKTFRNLLPTEYIQMAGRAGRRGHDETGTVIILCKNNVPSEKDLRDMTLGAPQILESKFKVTYQMILHLVRLSEAISIGDMMRRSFKEVDTLTNQKKYEDELIKVKKVIERTDSPLDQHKELELFCKLGISYLNLWEDLRPYMLQTVKINKLMTDGRILLISHKHHYNKFGIFLGIQLKKNIPYYKVFVLTSVKEEKDAEANNKSDIWHKLIALLENKFYTPSENATHTVLIVPPSSVKDVTNIVKNVNCKSILYDWERRQIPRFQDTHHNQSCQEAIDELLKFSSEKLKYEDIVIPVEVKFLKFELQTKYKQLQNLENTLHCIIEPIIQLPNFKDDFDKVFSYMELVEKEIELSKKLSVEYLKNYEEYESRVKVLKELNYIDNEDKVTLKGRVALEMGTFPIFLTELILDNILTNWQPHEIAAILSSLVFYGSKRNKAEEEKEEEIPALNMLKKEMINVHERLVTVETKYNLDPIPQPNFDLIRVVYEWASAKSFDKIMQLTDIEEGIIVRCIQQLNETLQDMKNAAIIIGYPALREKMEEAATKIKRDIVFTASLYTQD